VLNPVSALAEAIDLPDALRDIISAAADILADELKRNAEIAENWAAG
jgi:hypothetical protein